MSKIDKFLKWLEEEYTPSWGTDYPWGIMREYSGESEDFDYREVEENLLYKNRWSIRTEVIFEVVGEDSFLKFEYDQPATESQEGCGINLDACKAKKERIETFVYRMID